MHDPMTVAFEIPYRYKMLELGKKPWRYWVPLITVWHNDPERRGNDDSCGWFTPPFNETQREIVQTLARDEAREPWFMSLSAKANTNPVECEAYVRGAFLIVARCMENRGCLRRKVTLEQATLWASIMVHNPVDNFRNSLAFKSGYHSNCYHKGEPNSVEEDKFWREEQAKSFFGAILGYILREQRYWFEHPRWHIWHWSLQVHPLQAFKRWAFSRCAECGKRFSWGYAPGSNQWNGGGPTWFRGEPGVFHRECMESSVAKPQTVAAE